MPGSIRLFVEFELAEGGVVSLAEPQAHYLVNVMRRGPGDEVRLFNGRDGEWQARISVARRKNVELILEQQTRPQNV
ncbi:MAG TPA: 16S rRNA (uracil(1498)-N(3))-methyltransferase, partial [Acetobacteraceae bacterium]|nr:16S rRNA (uracil(1498)-N(3))-methyltransferase [Acetobacteraceae bacterium]